MSDISTTDRRLKNDRQIEAIYDRLGRIATVVQREDLNTASKQRRSCSSFI